MDQTQMNATQQAGAPAGAQAGAQPDAQAGAQGGLEQEGKDLATRLLLASMKIIYSNPQGFIKVMQSGKDLQQGVVHATDIVIRKMMESVKGVPPEDVQKVYPMVGKGMGPVIARMLVQLAEAAGLTKGAQGPGAGAPAGQEPAGDEPQLDAAGGDAAAADEGGQGGEQGAPTDEETDPSEPDANPDDQKELA